MMTLMSVNSQSESEDIESEYLLKRISKSSSLGALLADSAVSVCLPLVLMKVSLLH